MKTFERVVNGVYITGGLILVMIIVMCMSSCGSTNKCSNNKMVKQYSNW